MRRPTPDEIRRFWARVDTQGDCWVWTGSRLRKRLHGQFHYDRGTVYAHRFAWMLAHGDPGPQCVRHTCDNMLCVRVAHHVLGDQADNMQDMRDRGREAAMPRHRGDRHSGSKLTEMSVLEYRRRYAEGTSAAALSREAGVAVNTMWAAVTGRTWTHVIQD